MAVVETLVTGISSDVSEIKASAAETRADIKVLLAGHNKTVGAAGFFTRSVAVLALVASAISIGLNVFSKGFHF